MVTERTVLVRLKAQVNDFVSGMGTAAAAVKGLSHEVNTTNERTAWMAQGFLALAPALVPISAVAIPAVTTLATQFGLAAAAAGVGILAFQGVGGALKALNTYQLAPTAENLAKMRSAMAAIGPEGAQFVRYLNSLHGQLLALQGTAREAMFPGLEQGIKSMMTRLPEVSNLVHDIAGAMGDLAAQAGAGIGGPKFDDFFRFLDREARPLLEEMGATIGNFVSGLANMAVAFEPLTVTFSHGFLLMAQSFSQWADGLKTSASFTDFINYAQDSLPKVVDLLGAMTNLFVQLAQAAAPVGSIMLPALSSLLNVLANLANTPLGSVFIGLAAAMSIYGRAVALSEITTGAMVGRLTKLEGGVVATTRAAWAARPAWDAFGLSVARASGLVGDTSAKTASATKAVGGFARGMGPAAGAAGLLAFSMTGLADKMGLSNTASLGLLGTFAGPWGAAAGLAAGAVMDLVHSNDALDSSIATTNRVIQSGSVPAMKQLRDEIQGTIDDFDKTAGHAHSFSDFLSSGLHLPKNMMAAFSGSIDDAGVAVGRLEEAMSRIKLGSKGLPQLLSGDLLKGVGLTGAGFHTAAQSADEFTRAVDRVNQALTGRASLRDYQAALDDFTKAVKKNGKTLDITTEKGRNVQSALDAIAGTALKAAEGLSGLQKVRFLEQARKDFIAAAKDLGKTDAQAKALADRFHLLNTVDAKPKVDAQGIKQTHDDLSGVDRHFQVIDNLSANPKVTVNGVGTAIATVNQLRYAIDAVRSKTVTIHVAHTGQGGSSVYGPSADGNLFEMPRIGDQQPQIRPYGGPAGLTWSEAGSGPWEAFISGHPDKVDRSRSIASEVVARLGGRALFANGGMLGGGQSVVAPAPVVNVSGASRDELRMLADMIGDRVARAVRSNGQAAAAASRLGVGP